MDFKNYDLEGFYDELFIDAREPRPSSVALINKINSLSEGELKNRQQAAELALLNMGVTFTVYSDESGIEKIFPFDIIPRIVEPNDWHHIENGLHQRIKALNLFVHDIYHEQKAIKDGIIPLELIESCRAYRKQLIGFTPPEKIWCHITGTDLIRHSDGNFYVLEDNLRCPSGVSYVLENRLVMKRIFPNLFAASNVLPVDDYPTRLLETLQWLSERENPTIVVLTPGIYNAAYFEHAFLAQQMGVELVEGCDLVVDNKYVKMRTTKGLQRVDVIYRRVDDDFIDPLVFRKDSLLGVPGIMEVAKKGNVAIANAPGTGIADDKLIYTYVTDLIKYYLSEEPILHNVQTYRCWDKKDRDYVLANIHNLVVKAVGESGGYGMLVGPHSTKKLRDDFCTMIKEDPRNYIAQPTLSLSRVPTIAGDHFEGRHVDLRPYILCGKEAFVMPGGLTRVALKKGSLVVNSSQGGGSKDTWVIA